MARPGIDRGRVLVRLGIIGLISSWPHAVALHTGLLPLNVLFTLFAAAVCIHFIEEESPFGAIGTFLITGALVDFETAIYGLSQHFLCLLYVKG